MSKGMDVQMNGEPIEGLTAEESYRTEIDGEDPAQSFLNVYRNRINPKGYIFTVEEGEETLSVRLTTENVKILMKHIIDTLY